MTEHTHARFVDGCYRCELHKDEIRAWANDLVVTSRGVVHEPDCSFVSSPTSTAFRWLTFSPLSGDRPCSRCLPGGLPDTKGLR